MKLRSANNPDIELIINYIFEFRLDFEDISPEQFTIAEMDGKIAGFGRIKKYSNSYELSTLGVLKEFRSAGIGSEIVEKIISDFPVEDVWIVTRIPEYFNRFGFKEADDFPEEIRESKLRICNSSCGESEKLYFMHRKRSHSS